MKQLAIILPATALFACDTAMTDGGSTSRTGPDTCLAAQFDTSIGERVYDQTITVPDGGIRDIAEGSTPQSMGNPSRLNVVIDSDGRIVRAFCG